MEFCYTPRVQDLRAKLQGFIDSYVLPHNLQWHRELESVSKVGWPMESFFAVVK